jgi:hypothetical protein
MTEEEFLRIFRKTKRLVDDAKSCQNLIGVDRFLTCYEKYKHYIFQDYEKECLDSSSFREYIYHMTCMVKNLEKEASKIEIKIPSNIINFQEYATKRAYN